MTTRDLLCRVNSTSMTGAPWEGNEIDMGGSARGCQAGSSGFRGLGCNGTVDALKDRVSGRVTGETHRERQRQAKQMSSARAC